MTTRTRTQTRMATGTRVGCPRTTGNPVGRPRSSPRTGKRVGRPKRDKDYEYGSKKKAACKQPPADPVVPDPVSPPRVHFELPPAPMIPTMEPPLDEPTPPGGLARAGGKDPVLARVEVDPGIEAPGNNGGDGNAGDGGDGNGGDGEDGGGGDGGNNSPDDEGSDDEYSYHTDEESDEEEDYDNPVVLPYELPGAPPALIGRTPAERRFSQYLAGPPFDCTVQARRVLYFQQFKSWDAVRDKAPEDLPKLFSTMTTKSFEVLHQETNTYVEHATKPTTLIFAMTMPGSGR